MTSSALSLLASLARLGTDERGATAVEYAIIACGIGAAVAGTVWSMGGEVKSLYERIAAIF
jgi:Flp pilus assembly pilin Flp